ncbi:MAG TPA: UDP-glucuronic acid decarboxylase family protein, partial [Beijerinckiaceae bacterium]
MTRKNGRKALVAGGAGFLGSHLCDALLADGWTVHCVDNLLTSNGDNLEGMRREPRFAFHEADVIEPLALRDRMDMIFNLACAASPPRYQADPVHTMMTSVVGSRNLLDIAARDGARYLQASTSEVYGDPEEHPQREAYWGNVNPTGPRACYDEGKRAAEALCFDNLRLGRVDVRVARIFNTYGPRMHPDDGRIVSNFVMQALRGQPLTVYGSGEQTRSFCYVSDLVDGLLRLAGAEENPRGPINLGNPGEFTIRELGELVLQMTGSSSPMTFRPLPTDDPRRRRPDISLAQDRLGWTPKVSLE